MHTFLILFLLVFSVPVLAQSDSLAELATKPGGSRILEYFEVFNSGDEPRLREFFSANLTAAALEQRPIEPRMEFHRQVRNDHQGFIIKKLLSVSGDEIVLLVQGKRSEGWVKYSFRIEGAAPNKIIGWMIEQTDAPEEGNSPNLTITNENLIPTVSDYLNELNKADKFSGVVMIAKDGAPIFSQAFGMADRQAKVPNNLQTKFNLGSINKIFTRIAIGQLVAQGKVSFNDKLGKFLIDYPNKDAREKVTVGQLVNMRSGVPDFFGDRFMSMPKNQLRKNSDFIPLFAEIPLEFEPGTSERYSNGGYVLLGAIIEAVSGMSYYDYVRENIFKPAGMSDTDSFETDHLPTNTANGYTRGDSPGSLIDNAETRPYRGSAAGGGYSTAADLLKFAAALKNRKLTVPDDNGQPRNDSTLGIAGGAPGINSTILSGEKSGFTVVVLSNYDPPSAEKVGIQIRDWLRQISN